MLDYYVTYFSISLFLQVRGAFEEEEEEDDEGVLGSVLLPSPLLVEGISVMMKKGIIIFMNFFQSQHIYKHLSYFKIFRFARNHRSPLSLHSIYKGYHSFLLCLPSFAHLENSGVILLEGIPPLKQSSTTISMHNSPGVLSIVQSTVFESAFCSRLHT